MNSRFQIIYEILFYVRGVKFIKDLGMLGGAGVREKEGIQ